PRDFAWPRPTIFTPAESGFISPTTAQIFEVPISNPTMMLEESNISSPGALRFCILWSRRRRHAGFGEAQRRIISHGQIQSCNGAVHPRALFMDGLPAKQLLPEII